MHLIASHADGYFMPGLAACKKVHAKIMADIREDMPGSSELGPMLKLSNMQYYNTKICEFETVKSGGKPGTCANAGPTDVTGM